MGLCTYRGPDYGWHSTAHNINSLLGRTANLADKMLPIPPRPVVPQLHNGLVNVPGSMLLLGRNGARRFVLPAVSRAKLSMGLARASHTGRVFHLWFHPSNFYYRRLEQLETLDWFLEHAANAAGRGEVDILTMASFAMA
jgi:hypothetical protein